MNKQQKPTITIGMPVFNDQDFVGEALESLIKQTWIDFEIIISDNCSTDKTTDICLNFAKSDTRIRYIRQDHNIGLTANMNYVLSQCRGKYFMWAASDDVWDSTFLQQLIPVLQHNPEVNSVFCHYNFINEISIPFGRIRAYSYNSPTILGQLLKFCLYYDDGCFYGIHRSSVIERTRLPIWWGKNAKTPMNNAYPVLAYIIASGFHKTIETKPLWMNRIKNQPKHFVTDQNKKLSGYIYFFLRKFNVFLLSVTNVYKASGSLLLMMCSLPAFFARFMIDTLQPILLKIRR